MTVLPVDRFEAYERRAAKVCADIEQLGWRSRGRPATPTKIDAQDLSELCSELVPPSPDRISPFWDNPGLRNLSQELLTIFRV